MQIYCKWASVSPPDGLIFSLLSASQSGPVSKGSHTEMKIIWTLPVANAVASLAAMLQVEDVPLDDDIDVAIGSELLLCYIAS